MSLWRGRYQGREPRRPHLHPASLIVCVWGGGTGLGGDWGDLYCGLQELSSLLLFWPIISFLLVPFELLESLF